MGAGLVRVWLSATISLAPPRTAAGKEIILKVTRSACRPYGVRKPFPQIVTGAFFPAQKVAGVTEGKAEDLRAGKIEQCLGAGIEHPDISLSVEGDDPRRDTVEQARQMEEDLIAFRYDHFIGTQARP